MEMGNGTGEVMGGVDERVKWEGRGECKGEMGEGR